MRFWGPILILVIGVLLLGLWGRADHAKDIEQVINSAVEGTFPDGTRHETTIAVSGRDIEVSGLAHNDDERSMLIKTLNDVKGRRVVRADQLALIPVASPYSASAQKTSDAFRIDTSLPDAKIAASVSAVMPDGAAFNHKIASGMPDAQWTEVLQLGASSLAKLENGALNISDRSISLSGFAATPELAAQASALSTQLPEGYTVDLDIDHPKPYDVNLSLAAEGGVDISGHVPEGFDLSALAGRLGVEKINSNITTGALGDPNAILEKIAVLKGNLGQFETAKMHLSADSSKISAQALADADLDGLKSNLMAGFGNGAEVNVSRSDTVFENGYARTNNLSGRDETFNNGFWLPSIAGFAADVEQCQTRTGKILTEGKIEFLSGKAQLDSNAKAVIDRLASLMTFCASQTDLLVELAGHTDSQGDDNANYALSVARTKAVKAELVKRGVPENRMLVIGHGETQPIASNDTAEGRAKNRRTEINWRTTQ